MGMFDSLGSFLKPLGGIVSSLAPVAGTVLGGVLGGPAGAGVGGGLGSALGNLVSSFGGGSQQAPSNPGAMVQPFPLPTPGSISAAQQSQGMQHQMPQMSPMSPMDQAHMHAQNMIGGAQNMFGNMANQGISQFMPQQLQGQTLGGGGFGNALGGMASNFLGKYMPQQFASGLGNMMSSAFNSGVNSFVPSQFQNVPMNQMGSALAQHGANFANQGLNMGRGMFEQRFPQAAHQFSQVPQQQGYAHGGLAHFLKPGGLRGIMDALPHYA